MDEDDEEDTVVVSAAGSINTGSLYSWPGVVGDMEKWTYE